MKSQIQLFALVAAMRDGTQRVLTLTTNADDAEVLVTAARAHEREMPRRLADSAEVINLREIFADEQERVQFSHNVAHWVSTHPLLAWVPTHELPNIEEVEAAAFNPYVGHFDEDAVLSFGAAMSNAMASARNRGKSGWESPATCSTNKLRALLFRSLARGELVDVANYAMMLWARNEQGGIPPMFFQDAFLNTAQEVLKRVTPQTEITNQGMRDVVKAYLEAVAKGNPSL